MCEAWVRSSGGTANVGVNEPLVLFTSRPGRDEGLDTRRPAPRWNTLGFFTPMLQIGCLLLNRRLGDRQSCEVAVSKSGGWVTFQFEQAQNGCGPPPGPLIIFLDLRLKEFRVPACLPSGLLLSFVNNVEILNKAIFHLQFAVMRPSQEGFRMSTVNYLSLLVAQKLPAPLPLIIMRLSAFESSAHISQT
jgi:hypothetical protein